MRNVTRFKDIVFNERISSFIEQRTYHAVVDFDNGFSASNVKGFGTYGGQEGLYEIAVIYLDEICYDTYLTDDVLGWLSEEDVEDTLRKIKDLPLL